jgi:hypothetical protein
MPKFHFEIVDGYRIEDPRGMDLATDRQAVALADQIAEQIAKDVEGNSLKAVVVKSDSGEEIYKTPIQRDSPPTSPED